MKVKNIASFSGFRPWGPSWLNMMEISLEDGTVVLVSHETPVAAFVPGLEAAGIHDQPVVRTSKKWSQTITRHTNKWLNQEFHCQPYRKMPQEFFDNLLSVAQ